MYGLSSGDKVEFLDVISEHTERIGNVFAIAAGDWNVVWNVKLDMHNYGMVPKELLAFLGFLGHAEFSPWKSLTKKEKKRTVCGCFRDSQ